MSGNTSKRKVLPSTSLYSHTGIARQLWHEDFVSFLSRPPLCGLLLSAQVCPGMLAGLQVVSGFYAPSHRPRFPSIRLGCSCASLGTQCQHPMLGCPLVHTTHCCSSTGRMEDLCHTMDAIIMIMAEFRKQFVRLMFCPQERIGTYRNVRSFCLP